MTEHTPDGFSDGERSSPVGIYDVEKHDGVENQKRRREKRQEENDQSQRTQNHSM
jgi:hypothetical protein